MLLLLLFFSFLISHTQTITIHYIYNSLQGTVIVYEKKKEKEKERHSPQKLTLREGCQPYGPEKLPELSRNGPQDWNKSQRFCSLGQGSAVGEKAKNGVTWETYLRAKRT